MTAPLTIPIVGRTDITVPADVTAVVLAVTGVTTHAGQLIVYSGGSQPQSVGQVHMLDPTPAPPGDPVATAAITNLVTVTVDTTGTVKIASTVPADAAVDIVGYYQPVTGPVADGRYVPVTTTRAYDSRE